MIIQINTKIRVSNHSELFHTIRYVFLWLLPNIQLYACHYKPWLIYFLPHFSLLEAIYVLNKEILSKILSL